MKCCEKWKRNKKRGGADTIKRGGEERIKGGGEETIKEELIKRSGKETIKEVEETTIKRGGDEYNKKSCQTNCVNAIAYLQWKPYLYHYICHIM